MKYPNPNILLMMAMADAYAMATEFLKLKETADLRVLREALQFKQYVQHPRHKNRAGTFTDDTEMALANTRVLIDHPPPYTALEFAQAWVNEFEASGHRQGYANGFYQALTKAGGDGQRLTDLVRIHGNRSNKNGSAMRAPVLGVLPNPGLVCEVATLQGSITHDCLAANFATRTTALMSHFVLYHHDSLKEMGRFCREHLLKVDRLYFDIFDKPWLNEPINGRRIPGSIATVHAAHHIIQTYPSLMDMLEAILCLGGDTDTVAAIVWGIASTRLPHHDIPAFMERDLEVGTKTGPAVLRELGERLMAAYV